MGIISLCLYPTSSIFTAVARLISSLSCVVLIKLSNDCIHIEALSTFVVITTIIPFKCFLTDESGLLYYLSNQRPDSRSGGILNESKLVSLPKVRGDKKGEMKKPTPRAQGYNPRGIFINLTLQKGDSFQDWANYVQCLRLYALIQYLDATNYPAPLHLAKKTGVYRPIQAISKP
ncbi:MAG TPA: hypothetical protein DCL61_20935 [Cyanobacteria bacterium UBA12227]|nr:hypothetical protein [Cyanobacteria bacterium UBA12227]